LWRKLLTEVAQRQDLHSIVEDFVDNAVGRVEHLAHRGLVPLRDFSTLSGEISEEFNPSHEPVEPFE
jgi:hypothetical protein